MLDLKVREQSIGLAAAASLALLAASAAPAQGPERDPMEAVELELGEPLEVPMRLHGGSVPAVDVWVEGEGPFNFLIDTGAAGAGRISAQLAERFGLKVVGQVTAGDGSGVGQQSRDVVEVPRLRVGDLSARDLAMILRGDAREGEGVDGTLGFGFFESVLTTLDAPNGTLLLEKGELAAGGPNVVSMEREDGVPTVSIEVGGVETLAHIDSGSSAGVILPTDAASKLEFSSEPRVVGRARTNFNTVEISQAQLSGDLVVAGHPYERPTVLMASLVQQANLGGAFLKDFAITIDQANDRVRFVKPQPVGD